MNIVWELVVSLVLIGLIVAVLLGFPFFLTRSGFLRRYMAALELLQQLEDQGTSPTASKGAPEALRASLPTCKYSERPAVARQEEVCAICVLDFLPDDGITVLPCTGQHCFHSPCLDEWLKRATSCPLCKHDLVAACTLSEADPEEARDPGPSSPPPQQHQRQPQQPPAAAAPPPAACKQEQQRPLAAAVPAAGDVEMGSAAGQ